MVRTIELEGGPAFVGNLMRTLEAHPKFYANEDSPMRECLRRLHRALAEQATEAQDG